MKPRRSRPWFPTWPFTAAGAGALTFLAIYSAGHDWPLCVTCIVALVFAFRLLIRGL